MTDFLGVIVLGVIVFVSTNIDDILLLMMFFADRSYNARQVVIGQYIGMGILVGFSALGAVVALIIPHAIIGLMGFIPIAFGIKELIELRKGDDDDDNDMPQLKPVGRFRFLTVAAVTIANGGDNIGVYVPVFANGTLNEAAFIIVIFIILSALWCAAGYYLVHNRYFGEQVQRIGHILLPFVLIGLGIYILAEAFLIQ